jgi:5,10-methylenetetrahydrofolate reductase
MSFQEKLSSGDFAVCCEMTSPKGIDISDLITHARHLKSRIDAVVIPDMDNGVMQMSALACGALMRQQGIEPMIHIYGRDRNRMALQGDLLAAHVLGIHNFLVVRGEEMINVIIRMRRLSMMSMKSV